MNEEALLRRQLAKSQRIVVKFGTNILVEEDGHPSKKQIKRLADQIARLHQQGRQIVIVSSGAIGSGLKALGMKSRPKTLPELQMAAAVGQSALLSLYQEVFASHGIAIGQILLSHDDLRHRVRHLNARNAFLALLKHRVIPIVNENDVVTVDEIRVGDNDVLASLVALLIGADALVFASTTNGFYDTHAGKRSRVSHIADLSEAHLKNAVGKGSALSTGGMTTKLKAAENVARMGALSLIADGRNDEDLVRAFEGDDVGTLIGKTERRNVKRRKQWIAFFNRVAGTIVVDAGAKRALMQSHKSLLPIGIVAVKGHFGAGALVEIEDANGEIFARGLSEYSSEQLLAIKGRASAEAQQILGAGHHDEVIHRDNIFTNT